MFEGIIIWVLVILGIPIGIAIWVIRVALRASRKADEVNERLNLLESEIRSLKKGTVSPAPSIYPTKPLVAPQPSPSILSLPPKKPTPPPPEESSISSPSEEPISKPPPLIPPVVPSAIPPPVFASTPGAWLSEEKSADLPSSETPSTPVINWEQFIGKNLFAWIGGLAFFLGMAFFVKYSVDNNWIGPELRIAIGFLVGLGLLVGGWVMSQKDYKVLGQSLCATGIVILYAVTFVCHHPSYKFLDSTPTLLLMILITAAAFLLAIRLDAQVVSILGLLGGFLTPILLSTGVDNPLGLFGYIAILDIGLLAVVLRTRWNYQALLAVIGTVLMQVGWVVKFFAVAKIFIAMSIFLGFSALFLTAFILARSSEQVDDSISASALIPPFVSLGFTFYLLGFRELGQNPGILFTFVLSADLILLALVLLHDKLRQAHLVAGGVVFILLSIWTMRYLSDELLNWGLGLYLLFAILHSVFPILLQQRRQSERPPVWWGHLFPMIALLLIIVHIAHSHEVSFFVWCGVMLLDVVAIALAIFTATILSIVGALLLTLLTAAVWILKTPAHMIGLPEIWGVVGGFAIFFFVASVFAARKITAKLTTTSTSSAAAIKESAEESVFSLVSISPDALTQLPAFSAIMPFLLLILVTFRLQLPDPSPIFGLALLLTILLLGVVRLGNLDWLTAIGLASVLALEHSWHFKHFQVDTAFVPLAWYIGFYGLYAIFPFLFQRTMETRALPWAIAALSGPLHFYLVHKVVSLMFPHNGYMGLLPLAFAIPALLSLVYLIRVLPSDHPHRNSQLAWFGGVTLFFITLIFPIQFDRQWITIGWALEGAALLWFFHRVPHLGLRLVGVTLLVVAFIRLLNPAILSYHAHSETPILNWYLYTYGLVAVSLFAGGKLLAPPRNMILEFNTPPLLYGLGTILAFLLMNIEIADYFVDPNSTTLTFKLWDKTGNLAQDMTYSIAWALFAFGLLIVGIRKEITAVRYASIGLLGITLVKLFFHDLRTLKDIYRIVALVGVALVLMVGSFLYQRFFTASANENKTQD